MICRIPIPTLIQRNLTQTTNVCSQLDFLRLLALGVLGRVGIPRGSELKQRSTRQIPLDEGTTLGPKEPQHTPDEAEQSKYRKLGYLRLLGSLNWAVRQCHIELGFYCSMLASVMSTPKK